MNRVRANCAVSFEPDSIPAISLRYEADTEIVSIHTTPAAIFIPFPILEHIYKQATSLRGENTPL